MTIQNWYNGINCLFIYLRTALIQCFILDELKSEWQHMKVSIGHLSLHSLQFINIHCVYLLCLFAGKQTSVCVYAVRARLSPELLKYFMCFFFFGCYYCYCLLMLLLSVSFSNTVYFHWSFAIWIDTCWLNDTIYVDRLAVAEKWSLFNIHTPFSIAFFRTTKWIHIHI